MRPALIRWTCRTSSPSSVGKTGASRAGARLRSGGPRARLRAGRTSSGWRCGPGALATGERATGSSRQHTGRPPPRETRDVPPRGRDQRSRDPRGHRRVRHLAHAVVVRDGEVTESWGDPDLLAYVRSAAAPLQALPLVPTTCRRRSSRSRAPRTRRGRAARRRARAARAGRRLQGRPRVRRRARLALRRNCSGKHAGFLFLCRARGWKTEATGSRSIRCSRRSRPWSPNGSGPQEASRPRSTAAASPTFALTLTEMARLFAGFVQGEPEGRELTAAMTRSPSWSAGRRRWTRW